MKKLAQSILEYTIIVSIAVAALTAMSLYVQRAVQANLKLMDDKITAQPKINNTTP